MSKTPQQELIEKDVDDFSALAAVAKSDGGKILVQTLMTDVVGAVERLTNYKGKTLDELISICADLNANLSLVRTLTRAEKNKKLAQEALQEALQE
jgi:hypothetical protein